MTELERWLALAMEPDPPRVGRVWGREIAERQSQRRGLLSLFFKHNGIHRGPVRSIEVCSLYRLYVAWHRKWCPARPMLAPRSFGHTMKLMGYVKGHEQKKNRRSHPILMNRRSAQKMRFWLKHHPDSPEDRALFHLRRKSEAPAAREAARETSPDLSPDHREGPGERVSGDLGGGNHHAG